MKDHENVTGQGSTPFLNRAQRRRWHREERRARRRGLIGPDEHIAQRLHQTPNHQVWAFTDGTDCYRVTADFDDKHSWFGHEVAILCEDARGNLHGACRVNGTHQVACFHIQKVIEIIDQCDCDNCKHWEFFGGAV